jgi:hypothetical protein
VPFLLAPAALQASPARLHVAASVLLAVAFAASWPDARETHRENRELGRLSCLDGVDLEAAALEGDVLYQAFARPGTTRRFAVGKHTFVRYAADREGPACQFRLSPLERDGWITTAGSSLEFSVRDVDRYVRWRFAHVAVPSSWLFPRPAEPAPPIDVTAWAGRHVLASGRGSALSLDGFARTVSSDPGNPPAFMSPVATHPRLLVPRPGASGVQLRTWAPDATIWLTLRVNGRPAGGVQIPPGWSEVSLPTPSEAWSAGWNVLELSGGATLPRLALDWLEVKRDVP